MLLLAAASFMAAQWLLAWIVPGSGEMLLAGGAMVLALSLAALAEGGAPPPGLGQG